MSVSKPGHSALKARESDPDRLGSRSIRPRMKSRHITAGKVAVRDGASVAVMTIGLLLAVVHPPVSVTPRGPTPTEWVVINVALGAVGGMLFHLFVGDERQPDRLFIALIGAINAAIESVRAIVNAAVGFAIL